MVTPNGNYRYGGNHAWPRGEYREVHSVELDYEEKFWTIQIWNPHLRQYSRYNPRNFEKRDNTEMAYEATRYFAVKLSPGDQQDGQPLSLAPITPGVGDMHSSADTTPLRKTRHEVKVDVQKIVQEGDRWLVVQTVCLIEGEEPRPPIRVTEYK